MGEIIVAIVLLLIAVAAFLVSFRSFREKGFLLSNAYLYASKKEREAMDKAPYYRQSAVAFAMIGLIFLLNGLSLLLQADCLGYLAGAVVAIALIYAVASSVAIEKRKKK